jgi:replicative DNA helicase
MHYTKFKIENRAQELSQITRSLKNLAREFKVPIIALSQLSRNVENRLNKRPILSDLRESGSIEQDADLVLMLYRENYYNSTSTQKEEMDFDDVELIIAKQRNGPVGTVNLMFNSSCTKFINCE